MRHEVWPAPGRFPVVAALLAGALVVGRVRVEASEGPPPTLNPKSYPSPSGRCALFVDPSDRFGRFGASYRLTKDGQEVWSGQRPFTLWNARVTDEGVAGGFAYTFGWRGLGEAREAGLGEFRVVILDPKGGVRLDRATRREASRFPHRPPDPVAAGLIMDAENDRMVVRVHDPDANRGAEAWWAYRLSDGNPLGDFRPRELMPDAEPARFIVAAKPVAGTPLTLLHWWRYDLRGRTMGARFTLVDPQGKPAWTLDLPSDYEVSGGDEARERLREKIQAEGALLDADRPGQFALRLVKDAKRVTFAVERGPGGAWSVAETARRDDNPAGAEPAPTSSASGTPSSRLRSLGRVVLKMPVVKPPSPIRNVLDFDVDGRGNLAFLRRDDSAPALVVVDPAGKVLRSVSLAEVPASGANTWSELAWVGGERYVLVRSGARSGEAGDAWFADGATGEVTKVPGFSCPPLSKVAGFPDGRFVVLDGVDVAPGGAVRPSRISSHDPKGKRLWSLVANRGAKGSGALVSPEDVAITSQGLLAVLDSASYAVLLFDHAGKFRGTIDLAKAWGRTPNYPSAIAADVEGGFLVHDFQGAPPIVRMKADGSVRGQFQPKYVDGRTFRMAGGVKAAPGGTLWACDGYVLLRLSEKGIVATVLGDPPSPDQLGEVAAVAVDRAGRFHAVSGRTGAIHVFEPSGRWHHVCRPGREDFPEGATFPQVTVSDTGEVYLELGGAAEGRVGEYLQFSSDGKRLGVEKLDVDGVQQAWSFLPGTGNRLVLGYEKAFLVDPQGKTLRTIDRRPDGNWLERPIAAATAPDGSFAIAAGSSRRLEGRPDSVCLYSAKGDPAGTVPLPEADAGSAALLAFDGEKLVVVLGKEILAFDRAGTPLGRYTRPEEKGGPASGQPFLTAGGRELLLFDDRDTFHRYAFP